MYRHAANARPSYPLAARPDAHILSRHHGRHNARHHIVVMESSWWPHKSDWWVMASSCKHAAVCHSRTANAADKQTNNEGTNNERTTNERNKTLRNSTTTQRHTLSSPRRLHPALPLPHALNHRPTSIDEQHHEDDDSTNTTTDRSTDCSTFRSSNDDTDEMK